MGRLSGRAPVCKTDAYSTAGSNPAPRTNIMEKDVTHVYVDIDKQCTHSYYEPVQWGAWEESWVNHFGSVHVDSQKALAAYSHESVPVDYEVKSGDIVYVVWAEYSSGNSFGWGKRNNVEVVHVFKDKDLAWDAYRALNAPIKKDNDYYDSWSVEFKTDSGKDMPYHRPWLGYFEHLDCIHVEEAIVE